MSSNGRLIAIGRVVKSHGLKGEVKVLPLTDNPQRFASVATAYLGCDASEAARSHCRTFSGVRFQDQNLILKLEGVDSREEADLLQGQFIWLAEKDLLPLPEGRYYIYRLIGLEVRETGGRLLGILADVLTYTANDIFVVKSPEGRELLIPALKAVVKEINPDQGLIRVDLPAGLESEAGQR